LKNAVIGAGTSYLILRMAPVVTPGSQVLAVDVQPEMVAMLKSTVRQTELTQIQPLLGAEDDVRLPALSVELVSLVDVYHERAFPFKALHKMREAQIEREAVVHALVWDRTLGSLPWQHLVVFRKRN
jgi:ubiquinone/menaquinone biosynthesis C-methylase UbiE